MPGGYSACLADVGMRTREAVPSEVRDEGSVVVSLPLLKSIEVLGQAIRGGRARRIVCGVS